MRPVLVALLDAHGLPGRAVPGYLVLVVVAAFVCSTLTLRQARRDGAPIWRDARTIAAAYVGALVGGVLFEALRALPEAIALRSFAPLLHAGRAAYGGLLFGGVAALLYLRRARAPIAPFFDRAAVGTGLAFAIVRTGCFLSGCDYGLPTPSPLGLRFPSGSLAALDHLERGWVSAGAPSLPVHATQLYEAAVGLLAAGVAWLVLRGQRRDGTAFLACLAVYATGRFAVEFLRGDETRGLYLGLSTAQHVSLALVLSLALLALTRLVPAVGGAPATASAAPAGPPPR